jgi:maltose-binding protein MalE
MMLKKITLAAAASALVLGTFGAAPSALAQDPTPTLAPSTEGTLTIWINQDREPIVAELGKKFETEYGVPVVIQTMGFGDVRTNFNIAAPAGEGPDIIAGAHDWIGQLYSNGLLEEIDLGEKAEMFDAGALSLFTYDGKLVGMPYQTEAIAMYYNTDLISEAPATWAEAIEISKALVADGKAEQGIAIPTDSYHSYPLLTAFGGSVFGLKEHGSYDACNVTLDSEGSVAGAEFLDMLVKEGIFRDGVGYDQGRDLFMQGKLGMWVTGPWALGDIRGSGIKYGVAPIPAGDAPSAAFIGGQGFMINKFSKNTQLAQAFLTEFIATDEAMSASFAASSAVSAWKNVLANEVAADADLVGFAASIAIGQPMPTIPEMAAFWGSYGNAVTLIYQQKEVPAAAMTAAAEAARAEIAKSTKCG